MASRKGFLRDLNGVPRSLPSGKSCGERHSEGSWSPRDLERPSSALKDKSTHLSLSSRKARYSVGTSAHLGGIRARVQSTTPSGQNPARDLQKLEATWRKWKWAMVALLQYNDIFIACQGDQSSRGRAGITTRLCTLESIALTRLVSLSSHCSPASSNTGESSPSGRERLVSFRW